MVVRLRLRKGVGSDDKGSYVRCRVVLCVELSLRRISSNTFITDNYLIMNYIYIYIYIKSPKGIIYIRILMTVGFKSLGFLSKKIVFYLFYHLILIFYNSSNITIFIF